MLQKLSLCIIYANVMMITASEFTKSLVAHSTEEKSANQLEYEITDTKPRIYEMRVKSTIRNRYAHTTVTSKVMNLANNAQEAVFAVVLPETAFISGFIMEIDDKNYTAYVKEKSEAKKVYDQAVAKGSAAAHIAVSARDSNHFSISVNIEPQSKAAFYLFYEELLKRENGHYELVINLHPGQPVKDLTAEVVIAESRKLTNLRAPPIRSGNEVAHERMDLDPRVKWGIANYTSAVIIFSPNIARQRRLGHLMGGKEEEGFVGQFVVQYDVERDPRGGEVLIQDGYFVHFFAPSHLSALPKHVVFVLDTSGSMTGQKMEQLKEAMTKILEQLRPNDLFHLVEFNSNIRVWDLDNPEASVWYHNYQEVGGKYVNLHHANFPSGYIADVDNVKKAKAIIARLIPQDMTNIYTALHIGLYLAEVARTQESSGVKRQPLIMFLTDGDPTVGVKSTATIINDVSNLLNSRANKVPIFSLSFGDGADRNFLQKLSIRNSGFSKHIYEAADAALQLQHFYKQISSPLLSNITFKYDPTISDVTSTEFPIYFSGSELVVAGWCGEDESNTKSLDVEAWDGQKYVTFQPNVRNAVGSLERLWAYLTIKQILERSDSSTDEKEKDNLKQKALDLALKYSFVTPVSSLVVVKPNSVINTIAETMKIGYRDVYNLDVYSNHPSGGNNLQFQLIKYLTILPFICNYLEITFV